MTELKPTYSVYPKPPITSGQAAIEVDVTPTGEGMQVAPTRPSHETAPVGQYSPQFEPLRFALAIAGVRVVEVTNIPRKWVVWVNRNAAAGALMQVQSGSYDVTLGPGDSCTFPGRSHRLTITCTVAAGDITVIAAGDDEVRF